MENHGTLIVCEYNFIDKKEGVFNLSETDTIMDSVGIYWTGSL
jgi:hypothetical protein